MPTFKLVKMFSLFPYFIFDPLVLLLMAGPLRKNTFLGPFFQCSKIAMAIKLEGGGGLGLNALMARPLREGFLGLSLLI